MTDALQILLAVVISSLTVVLVIIGIEFFFILKELRQSVIKMNKIVDDTSRVSEVVADGAEDVSDFMSGVKKGAGLIGLMKKIVGGLGEEKD